MKSSVVPFIALRYLRSKRRSGGFTPSVLSVVGVAVGVMTLTVVLGVMNGFQIGFIENMVEVGSYHIQLSPAEGGKAVGLPKEVLDAVAAVPGVAAVVPFRELQGLAQGVYSKPQPCVIRAVPADLFSQDPVQERWLEVRSGSFSVSAEDSIVIGTEMANNTYARVGDVIVLQTLAVGAGGIAPLKSEFTVTGIFRCGYQKYDAGLLFISEAGADNLARGRPLQVTYGVKLARRFRDADALAAVSGLLADSGYEAESWRTYNREFFSALFVEKLMLFVLVGLIFIVVGFNIYNSLRRTVFEKKEEIAVLKAVGVPPRSIQYAFIFEGVIIGAVGTFVGVLLGVMLAMNVNEVFTLVERLVNGVLRTARAAAAPFAPQGAGGSFAIFSPMYFYLTKVTSQVLFTETFFVAFFGMAACAAAAYGASRSIASFRPAEILRYE